MFDRLLLKSQSENPGDSEHFRSCLNAHGLYSTLHFVLRLSPKIHRTLSETPSGIYASSNISFEQIEAFSTYLHETVHWWQHIGSTSGLILSLSRPVQAHSNFAHLKTYLREIGPKKSILQFATANTSSERISECGSTATNIIINNFKDLSFYQTISVRPDLIRTTIADDPFFENIGHSYLITYEGTLHLLANLFDPKFHFFPDPRKWKTPFRKLKDEKIVGFYRGSPIEIPPVGLWGIFEGQARFTQLTIFAFCFRRPIRLGRCTQLEYAWPAVYYGI